MAAGLYNALPAWMRDEVWYENTNRQSPEDGKLRH
jgi:hypothetical protein